ADGTAHVDVEAGNAVVFEPLRRGGHFVGVGPEQLHGEGAIFRGRGDQFQGLLLAFEDGSGVHEVRRRQAQSTECAQGQGQSEIGVARQRREIEATGQYQVAVAQRLVETGWNLDHYQII